MSTQPKSIPERLFELIDKVRRRIAYVPAVNDTINSMKELGINLTNEAKKNDSPRS